MKLFEKLAEESRKAFFTQVAESLLGRKPTENEIHTMGRVSYNAGFEAGFRMTRELAAQEARKMRYKCHNNRYSYILEGYIGCSQITEEAIKKLGEEEV